MNHIKLFEDFREIPDLARDIFDVGFTKILLNRTIIKGPIYSKEEIESIFTERKQYELISSCYRDPTSRYFLDSSEVSRSECAEKNIRNFIGDKLEELECEIIYYRPMYIDSQYNYIKVYAPGANWDSGNELKIPKNFYDRSSESAKDELPKIIQQIKLFASKHKVTHVLPHGSRIMEYGILYDQRYPEREKAFTPINKFNWEKYYW